MTRLQVFLSAMSAGIITGGGAVAIVVATGNHLNTSVWTLAGLLGAVAAAKDYRATMKLPPVSIDPPNQQPPNK